MCVRIPCYAAVGLPCTELGIDDDAFWECTNRILWEKDVRTITNDIEKHLKRCDFRLDYKKSKNGYQYYTDIKPADPIALAYYQLAKKLSLPIKTQLAGLCGMRSTF